MADAFPKDSSYSLSHTSYTVIYHVKVVTLPVGNKIIFMYVFFWVFPRRPIVVSRCFGTLYQFHLQGLDVKYEEYIHGLSFFNIKVVFDSTLPVFMIADALAD